MSNLTAITVLQCLMIVLIPCIVVFPVIRYTKAGLLLKQREILDGQSPLAAGHYFEMFCKATRVSDEPQRNAEELKRIYLEWYGPQWFSWPILIVTFVTSIASYVEVTAAALLVCRANDCVGRLPSLFTLPVPAMTALAGALVWVADDFILRARRFDFSPSDVHWGTLRVAGSIPVGYAFVYFYASIPPGAEPESMTAAAFVAFAIAAFPLNTTRKILRRVLLGQPKLAGLLNLSEETDEVMKLQGVNNDISVRLAQEDIATITQVAYCDPIRITMRSGLSFNFITDCMNQALAWEYLEDGMNSVRPLGFRGVIELSKLYSDLSKDGLVKERAVSVLDSICKALNATKGQPSHTKDTLLFLLRELSTDNFTIYLVSISDR